MPAENLVSKGGKTFSNFRNFETMADNEQGAASASGSREDPNKVADEVVNNLKSQGLFDQFRKECLEELENVEAYRLLKQRVENHVASFLSKYRWSEKMSKNSLRNNLRMNINRSEVLLNGIDRLVDQILASRSESFADRIGPEVDKYLGIDKEKEQTPEEDTMEVEPEFFDTNIMPSASKYHDAKPPQSLSLQLEGKITNFSPTASFLPPEQTFIDPPTDYGSPKMIESLMDRKFAESKVASSSWGMQSFQGSLYDSTAGFAQKEEILQAWQTSNAHSQLQSKVTGPREVSSVSNVQSTVGLDEGYATKQERKDSEIKARIHRQYIAAQEHIRKQSIVSNNSEESTEAVGCSRSAKEPCMASISSQMSGDLVTTTEDLETDVNQGANDKHINSDEMCLNRKKERRLSDSLPQTDPSESPVTVVKAYENLSAGEVQNCTVAGDSKCDISNERKDSIDASQKENSAIKAEELTDTNPIKAVVEITECHVSRAGIAQESVINVGTKIKETVCKSSASANSLQEEVITMNETDNCISFEEFKKKREKLATTERLQVEKGTMEGKSEVAANPEMSVDEEKANAANDTLEEHDIYAMLEEAVDKEECYAKKKQGMTFTAKEGKKECVPAITKEGRKEVLESLQKEHKEEVENSTAVKEGMEKNHAPVSEKNDQIEASKQENVTEISVLQQCERIGTVRTEMEQDKPGSRVAGNEEINIREKDDTDSVLQRPNDFEEVQKELITDRDPKERNSIDSFEDKIIDIVRESGAEGNAICRTDAEANKGDIETGPKPESTKESIMERELSYDPISPITSNADTAESQVELLERHQQNVDHGMQEGNVSPTTESVVEGMGDEDVAGAVEADVVSQTSSEGDSKKDEPFIALSQRSSSSKAGVDLQLGVGQRRVKRRKRLISESGGGDGKEAKASRTGEPTMTADDKLKKVTKDDNATEVSIPKKQRGRPKKAESTKSDSQPSSDCDMPEDESSVAEQGRQSKGAATEEAKPKRGRGRPKATNSTKSDSLPSSDCDMPDDDSGVAEQEKQNSGAASEEAKPKRGRGRPKGTNSTKSDSLPASDSEMPHDDQETSLRDRSRSRSRRADDFDNIRGIDRQRSIGSESNASDTCVEGKDADTRRTRRQIKPKRCYSPSDSK